MIISILYNDITQYHIEVYDIKLYDTILSFIIWNSFVLSTSVLIDIDHTLQYEFEYKFKNATILIHGIYNNIVSNHTLNMFININNYAFHSNMK